MASKAKKDALAALDEANKEYKQVCSNLKKKYAELDKAADNAITLISNVEILIESIRHRPWSYKAIKKKIAVTKKKFVETKELKRKERNKNISAGVVAGGVFAGGRSLLLFVKEFCQKNIIKWIICLVLSPSNIYVLFVTLSVSVGMWVSKSVQLAKMKTAPKWCCFSFWLLSSYTPATEGR